MGRACNMHGRGEMLVENMKGRDHFWD